MDGEEPPLDAAVQRVVVAALVVRLVRLAPERDGRARARLEAREAALPVAAAVCHERVDAEVLPRRGEGRPPALLELEDLAHAGRAHEREALRSEGRAQIGEVVSGHGGRP